MKNLWIYDSEGDGLCGKNIPDSDHITKFHCFLFKKYAMDDWVLFLDHTHPEFQQAKDFAKGKGVNLRIKDMKDAVEFKKWIREPDVEALGCQNCFGFDLPAMKHVWGLDYGMFPFEHLDGERIKLYDTLSMSRGLYPDRPLPKGCPAKVKNPLGGKARTIGSHSLEAWGYKLANQKVEISDWRNLPLWRYVDRVWEDVIINEMQWKALMIEMQPIKRLGVSWATALRRNMLADYLMAEQEEQGVVLNSAAAEKLLVRIDGMMEQIAGEVEPKLPMKDVPPSRQPNFPKNPFTGSGDVSANGWNYAEKILDYPVNREALTFKHPPATAIKKDGTVSKAGERYCEEAGINENLKEFIEKQKAYGESLEPLPSESLQKLKGDLRRKFMPSRWLKEPMKISNQDDIKEWLLNVGGWVPTLFNTKDVTKDDRKQMRSEEEIADLVWEYIQEVRASPYKKFIYKQLGKNLDVTTRSSSDFRFLCKKARYLPMSPKLKDERGELCPNLEKIEGDMAKSIVKWLSLRNRRAVIKSLDEKKTTGWLNHPRLQKDGKLPARASGLTNTNRRKHAVICNVPKPKDSVLLGKEMRALITVPEGYMQLGCDAGNMENIIAAWWAWKFGNDNGDYYKTVSEGDPHSSNAAAYSQAAGREVSRDEGKGITYACLPKDTTEVLTGDGWKRFDELVEGEAVLSYNPDTGESEWDTILKIHDNGVQEVMRLSNSHFEFEATNDHRWFGSVRRQYGEGRFESKEFFTTEEIHGEHKILRVAELHDANTSNLTQEEAYLLGMIAGDGYSAWSKKQDVTSSSQGKRKGIVCTLIQSEKKYLTKIENILDSLGCSYGKHLKKGSDACYSLTLNAGFVRELLDRSGLGRSDKHEADWESLVLRMSFSEREAWYKGFYEAEGWKDSKGVELVCQNTGNILEAVKLCVYLLGDVPPVQDKTGSSGFANSGACKNVRVCGRKYVTGQRLTKKVSREANVFCITTKNSTFVARQGDHITITGNCLYGAGAAKIAAMLGVSSNIAKAVIDALWDNNPGLKSAKAYLEHQWEASGKKFIVGVDGRKIWTRAKSSLLNAAFQSTGAIMMDLAGIIYKEKSLQAGLEEKGIKRTIYYHKQHCGLAA